MLKSIDPPPYHRIFRRSLQKFAFAISQTIQKLLYNCYTTLSSQPKTKYLSRPFQCLLLAPCKGIVENITAASRRMSSLFVRSTHCFLYDKDSCIKSSRRATKSLLLPGVLILFGPRTRARTRSSATFEPLM